MTRHDTRRSQCHHDPPSDPRNRTFSGDAHTLTHIYIYMYNTLFVEMPRYSNVFV